MQTLLSLPALSTSFSEGWGASSLGANVGGATLARTQGVHRVHSPEGLVYPMISVGHVCPWDTFSGTSGCVLQGTG